MAARTLADERRRQQASHDNENEKQKEEKSRAGRERTQPPPGGGGRDEDAPTDLGSAAVVKDSSRPRRTRWSIDLRKKSLPPSVPGRAETGGKKEPRTAGQSEVQSDRRCVKSEAEHKRRQGL